MARCQILQRNISVIYFSYFVFIQTCKAITFSDKTVRTFLKNNLFLPIRGTESEVAGMISATNSMKTVSDSNTVMPGEERKIRKPKFTKTTEIYSFIIFISSQPEGNSVCICLCNIFQQIGIFRSEWLSAFIWALIRRLMIKILIYRRNVSITIEQGKIKGLATMSEPGGVRDFCLNMWL